MIITAVLALMLVTGCIILVVAGIRLLLGKGGWLWALAGLALAGLALFFIGRRK